ncbi:MAG: hypothetical protein R3B72_28080 [Polyangiaceae bacterium]
MIDSPRVRPVLASPALVTPALIGLALLSTACGAFPGLEIRVGGPAQPHPRGAMERPAPPPVAPPPALAPPAVAPPAVAYPAPPLGYAYPYGPPPPTRVSVPCQELPPPPPPVAPATAYYVD